MGRVIFITSFKGGVGKTSVSANLAGILARMGKKVLAVDGDFGMRCLDMALGLESDVIYDIHDVIDGKCGLEDATIACEGGYDLSFLAAPMTRPDTFPPADKFMELFKKLRGIYDYIIVDSSAEESPYYLAFASAADDAIVVSLHQSLSIRAAEKTGMRLKTLGFRNLRLVVNGYRDEYARAKALPSLYELIHLSSIRLLGVIPYDASLVVDQENGRTAFSTGDKTASPYEAAVFNIASRITGRNVPLLCGVTKPARKKQYEKYFVRAE